MMKLLVLISLLPVAMAEFDKQCDRPNGESAGFDQVSAVPPALRRTHSAPLWDTRIGMSWCRAELGMVGHG